MKRRQLLLLGGLAAVLVIGLWQRLATSPPEPVSGGGPRASAAHAKARTGPTRRRAKDVPTDRAIDLDLAALEHQPGEYRPGRNPWSFYVAPPPQPKGPTREELEALRRAQEEAERRRAAEAARLANLPPQPPEIPLVYLGSFGPRGRRIAVFSDGGSIYNAAVGEVLQGKFILVSIGLESVDIKYVDFPDAPARRLAVGKSEGA